MSVGTLAFDVKAKTPHRDAILIDEYEHRTFTKFETFFNISIWYAVFPPRLPWQCHLFLNRALNHLPVTGKRSQACIAVPIADTFTARLVTPSPTTRTLDAPARLHATGSAR